MLEDYPDVLNSKDMMQILDISKELLYRLIKEGKLPAFRIGKKRWRISKASLIEYINSEHNYSRT